MRLTDKQLLTVLDNCQDAIVISQKLNNDIHIIHANDAFEKLTHFKASELNHTPLNTLFHHEKLLQLLQSFDPKSPQTELFVGTIGIFNRNTIETPCEVTAIALPNRSDDSCALALICKKTSASLITSDPNDALRYDSITPCLDKTSINRQVEYRFHQFQQNDNLMVLGLFQLDNLATLVECYPEPISNQVLIETIKVVNTSIRTNDLIGRIDNNEFLILYCQTALESCQNAAKRLCRAIYQHQFDIEEIKISTSLSLGLTPFNQSEANYTALIDKARIALRMAKSKGGNAACVHS